MTRINISIIANLVLLSIACFIAGRYHQLKKTQQLKHHIQKVDFILGYETMIDTTTTNYLIECRKMFSLKKCY